MLTYSEPVWFGWLNPRGTQWAAVKTYLSPNKDPPQRHFSRPVYPEYPNKASHGYFPIGASEPPTILVQALGGQSLRPVAYLRLGWASNLSK